MQHRAVHRFEQRHHQAPLLPVQQQAQAALRVSKRQLHQAGVVFASFILLFVVFNYHRQYQALQKPRLSSCPDRLAALGLNLNAAPSDVHQFITSGSASGAGQQLYALKRHQLYEQMSTDLKHSGLTLGGVITQGLTQDELFKRTDAAGKSERKLQPVMRQLQVPVRAVVLPLLDHEAAQQVHTSVRQALQQVLSEDSVWYQDQAMMHSTLYHASTFGHPVPATEEQVHKEYAAVASVAGQSCPIRAVLDRVVITSTGVVVACWQVLPNSSEPAAIRAALKQALPAAPPADKQAVTQPSILHMTVARLLAPAKLPGTGHTADQLWDARYLQQALIQVAADISNDLCGLLAHFEETWFVEEHTLLALGLGGKYVKHPSQFRCPTRT